jgi:hypothetical protein
LRNERFQLPLNLYKIYGGYGYGFERHFQQYYSYIMAVIFICGGNRRKPQVTD